MEGHFMHRNSKLPAVHPVHEGEDGDPTRKETEEDNDAVEPVQPGVVKAQLDIRGQEKEGMWREIIQQLILVFTLRP